MIPIKDKYKKIYLFSIELPNIIYWCFIQSTYEKNQ